jgi:branched-chain amino acid transport system permease protein
MQDIPQFLVDGFLLGGLYMLASVGLALGFGVVRFVNFAQGEMFMLGAYGAFWASHLWGLDPLVSLLPLMLLGGAAGFGLFRVLSRSLVSAPPINQILVTFGLGLILQNVALIAWSGDQRSTNPPYALTSLQAWHGMLFVPVGRLIACVAALVLVAILFVWLKYSELGRASRALSENRIAATLMGIPVERMYALTFGVSIALGVATGVLISSVFPVTPFMGFDLLIKGFAVIVLGGMGSILGAVAGAFILAYAETFLAYFVPDGTGWGEGVAFALLFLVLLLRPRGLLGQAVEV